MAGKKKYYAVYKGRKPGIYNNWPEAKSQIDGFNGAVYKGFVTYDEAAGWMKKPVIRKNPAKGALPENHGASGKPKPGEVTVYTDGGSLGNPGPGGYGAVIMYEGKIIELSGGFRLTTNNRMELTGAIVALQNLPVKEKPVTLYTDSSYVVNGITKGWAKKWRANNWIKSDKKPAINPDLWGVLLDLVEVLDITFMWVKGHAGNEYNERCDRLAVASAKGADLAEDTGYSG